MINYVFFREILIIVKQFHRFATKKKSNYIMNTNLWLEQKENTQSIILESNTADYSALAMPLTSI